MTRSWSVLVRKTFAAGLVLSFASCGKPPETVEAPFDTSLPTVEVMEHVLQSNADRFWAGSGTVSDMSGVHSRKPTTPEGWQSVEDGAAGVIEGGNLLLLPGRPRAPETDWNRHTLKMVAVAKEALAAAQKQDEPAMMEVGSRLYEACNACHVQYMTPAQRGLEPEPETSAAQPDQVPAAR